MGETFEHRATWRGNSFQVKWHSIDRHANKAFSCGHCGQSVISNTAYWAHADHPGGGAWYSYVCHYCMRPTFFAPGEQIPGPRPGAEVLHVPADVKALYDEARDCCKVNAYTSSVMASRKLLMHLAVSKGDKPGKSFVDYVTYLESKAYAPPDSHDWVDHIRSKGNEANHEVRLMKQEDAEALISFLEMLLKFMFEFQGRIKTPVPAKP